MTRGALDEGKLPQPPEADLELWQNIRTVYRTVLKKLNARLSKQKITFPQYNVLLVLSESGPIPMNELGERMLVAAANVTGLVDRMERNGYVRRRRDEKDRRLYVIEPTLKGTRIFRSISKRFRHYVGGLGSTLSQMEFAATLEGLRKVRAEAEEPAEL